jgi:hypothetical protein
MKKKCQTKLVHEGKYIAEVDVELIELDSSWSPYLSVEDACKLDEVREALRGDNLDRALQLARVYTLTPVK